MSDEDDRTFTDDELWAMLAESEGRDRVDILSELAERALGRGDHDRAMTLLAEVHATAREIPDAGIEGWALSRQAWSRFRLGQYEESARLYSEAARAYSGTALDGAAARALWGQADALMAAGQYVESLGKATEALGIAESEGEAEMAAEVAYLKARALYYLDHEQESLEACKYARNNYRALGLAGQVARVDDFAMTVLLYLGELDRALELARGCVVLADESPSPHDDAYARRRLAEVYLARRETANAIVNAELAREHYRGRDDLLGVARSERLRAEAIYQSGRMDDAVEAFRAARVLLDAHGKDYEALKCDVWRAVALHSLGEYEHAARLNARLANDFRLFDFAGAEEDARWSAVRLQDNLFESERFDACVADGEAYQGLWGDRPDVRSRSYREFLGLRAAALEETGHVDQAAWLASRVIKATKADEATRSTALCYEIRGRTQLAADAEAGSQDLAHAISLHLAIGDTHRARDLSEHFLPHDRTHESEGLPPTVDSGKTSQNRTGEVPTGLYL